MDNLDDLAMMPDMETQKHEGFEHHDIDSEGDSGDEGEDEGNRALLAPRGTLAPREVGRYPAGIDTVWKQVRRLVIEV